MQGEQEPDWETVLKITLTPAMLINSLFAQAHQVHTGAESCVPQELVLNELMAVDERTGNHARLLEQEYSDDEHEPGLWHDWTVEVRIGDVWVTAHWQQPLNASPMEWDWCARRAEQAFAGACVLFGKQVRPGLVVLDAYPGAAAPSSSRRH